MWDVAFQRLQTWRTSDPPHNSLASALQLERASDAPIAEPPASRFWLIGCRKRQGLAAVLFGFGASGMKASHRALTAKTRRLSQSVVEPADCSGSAPQRLSGEPARRLHLSERAILTKTRDPQPMNGGSFTTPPPTPPVGRGSVITAPLSPGCMLVDEPSQEDGAHVSFPARNLWTLSFSLDGVLSFSKDQHLNPPPPFFCRTTNPKWGTSVASGVYRI